MRWDKKDAGFYRKDHSRVLHCAGYVFLLMTFSF
jgi:hypothetical protein